jgi:hypothetical protein
MSEDANSSTGERTSIAPRGDVEHDMDARAGPPLSASPERPLKRPRMEDPSTDSVPLTAEAARAALEELQERVRVIEMARVLPYHDIAVYNGEALFFTARVIMLPNAWLCYVLDDREGRSSDVGKEWGTFIFPRWINCSTKPHNTGYNLRQLDHEIGEWSNLDRAAVRGGKNGLAGEYRLALGILFADCKGDVATLLEHTRLDLKRDYARIRRAVYGDDDEEDT